jgi:hypothetical protein
MPFAPGTDIMKRVALALITCLALAAPRSASAAIELIANGDFSSALAGWTVFDQPGGDGTWFDSVVGSATPISGFPTSALGVGGATPLGGYAVTDQGGPGAHALEQSFLVPGVASSVILTFDLFANDQSGAGPIVDPAGLDFTAMANQHARVDLLSAGSSPLDTTLGVLLNVFTGNDPAGGNPNPFTRYAVDITSIVGAGGLFDLRFAEVDNQLFFHLGVDNVSVLYTPRDGGTGDVPEPMTLAVWSTLATLGAAVAWRKSRRP